MSEALIPKIEKQDIQAPPIKVGGTAIVLQRHERYERDRAAEEAGSIFPEAGSAAYERDTEFFRDVLAEEQDGGETMFLFISSDTQYADKGHRSMETTQIAQDAAADTLRGVGIDPAERIINLNPNFRTKGFATTGQQIRHSQDLREPQIFDTPEYVDHLRTKYGAEDGPGAGISQQAWAAHESDAEKEAREQFGAEGVYDMLDRTKHSIATFQRYSQLFHQANPGKRLVIWAGSHYDTISPLVKDAAGTDFEEYVPVDYGGGVVMNIAPDSNEIELTAQQQHLRLELGKRAVEAS